MNVAAQSQSSDNPSCASRPGSNLCLEIGIRTLTGDTYYLCDPDRRAGGNRQVTALYDYLRAHYPSVRFERKAVDTVR